MEDKKSSFVYNHDIYYDSNRHKIIGETNDLYVCEHMNSEGIGIYKVCFQKNQIDGVHAKNKKVMEKIRDLIFISDDERDARYIRYYIEVKNKGEAITFLTLKDAAHFLKIDWHKLKNCLNKEVIIKNYSVKVKRR